jgi:hypothetical protein
MQARRDFALPPPKSKPEPESVTSNVTASAERRKAEYAATQAAEVQPEAQPDPVEPRKPDPLATSKVKAKRSDQALGEFKFSAKRWLRDMTPDDQRKALEYVSEMMERLTEELAA